MKQSSVSLITDCRRELSYIDSIIDTAPLDPKVQYLTMYSLIKACGTIEQIFKAIIADYFSKTTITQVQNYLDLTVREAPTSPKYDNICSLLKKFDMTWETSFKVTMKNHADTDKIKSSLNSLVNNRHQFAHGKNPNVSFMSIKNYFEDAVIVLKILDSCVK